MILFYTDEWMHPDGFYRQPFTLKPEKQKESTCLRAKALRQASIKSGKYSKKNKAAEEKQQPCLADETQPALLMHAIQLPTCQ